MKITKNWPEEKDNQEIFHMSMTKLTKRSLVSLVLFIPKAEWIKWLWGLAELMSDFLSIAKRRLLVMSIRDPETQRWVSKHYLLFKNMTEKLLVGTPKIIHFHSCWYKICMQSQCKNILSYFIISRIYSVNTRQVY